MGRMWSNRRQFLGGGAATRFAAIAMALAGIVGSPRTAAASCAVSGPPPANPYALLPVVFVGTVTATTHENRIALVHVESVWRGPDLPLVVEVRGSSVALTPVPPGMGVASSEDHYYQVGQRYIVAPSNDTPPLNDGACSWTRPYSAEIAALVPGIPCSPASSPAALVARAAELPQTGAFLARGHPVLAAVGLAVAIGLAVRAWSGAQGRRTTGKE